MTEQAKQLLQVGDVVYKRHHGYLSAKYSVIRVTNTQAIITMGKDYGEVKVKREMYLDGYTKEIGTANRFSGLYQQATPELDNQWELRGMLQNIMYLKESFLLNMKFEDLREINSIVLKYKS